MVQATDYIEHRVVREQGYVYARDYSGQGPAFVLMHGFPDDHRIYDDLVPLLVAAGRRVVTFDFLGFGMSEKRSGVAYGFAQQLGDLEAVVDGLDLGQIVPVAHDASGMAAVNYALARPDGVASVIMLNSAYADDDTVIWPEMITLFATKKMQDLSLAIAQSPEQFGWLLHWQQKKFEERLSVSQREKFGRILQPIITGAFTEHPSSGPAFLQIADQFFEELRRNAGHVPELQKLDVPFKLIWGERDPYLTLAMAERRLTQLKHGALIVLPAGHWLQLDEPALVAKSMLS
ncbi:alpha/beta fold hydrolase [Lichenicoccus sp.]|uniref:alpha/beta fold hydrolase n=1 Tax=Lichenicoccus sp. TaxID=2781899 RepID=UPI003D0C293F